jgi:hypothetical protein
MVFIAKFRTTCHSGQTAKKYKFVLDFHRIPEIIVQVDEKPKVLEFQKESNCK